LGSLLHSADPAFLKLNLPAPLCFLALTFCSRLLPLSHSFRLLL
jgi:hypothetical protein